MRDEIAGGGDGRVSRRSIVGLVLLGALLAGYALSHRHHPTTTPPTRTEAAPQVQGPVRRLAVPTGDRAELFGSVRAGPAGLRVLVDGIAPRVVDAHALSVTPVPGLPLRPGQPAQVLQLGSAGLVALAPLYGSNGGVYLVRPGQRPLLLAGDRAFLPGRNATLVMATYQSGGTTVTGLGLDRRVRWQWTLPGNVDPLRDTPDGLVVSRYPNAAGDAEFLLLDRATSGTRRRLGHGRYALAADDRSIVWLPSGCRPDCATIRTDLATGAVRRYRMPHGREPAAAAFAADGQRLALSFAGVPAMRTMPSRPGLVAVLDLRTGSMTTVPGLATPPSDHADVAWSADGRWLVLGVAWPEEELIALWRPGSEVIILPLALPGAPTVARVAGLP